MLESPGELFKPTGARIHSPNQLKSEFLEVGLESLAELSMSPGDSNMHIALRTTTLERTTGTFSGHEAL